MALLRPSRQSFEFILIHAKLARAQNNVTPRLTSITLRHQTTLITATAVDRVNPDVLFEAVQRREMAIADSVFFFIASPFA